MIEPWAALSVPRDAGAISARRVSVELKWNFYWALNAKSNPMLLLECEEADESKLRFPELHGIQLHLHRSTTAEISGLGISLLDRTQDALFLALCEDLIAAGESGSSPEGALFLVLQRLWRWHYLLRRGQRGDLTLEEEAGLLAELAALDRYLLLGPGRYNGVASWKGPLGAAQDFQLVGLAIEVKATGIRRQRVHISSEFQLDSLVWPRIYLVSIQIVRRDPSQEGLTLHAMVGQIRNRISHEAVTLNTFDSLLAASGYRAESAYDRVALTLDEGWSIYRIEESFPAIKRSVLPSAVQRVSYELDLAHCTEFEVPDVVLQEAIQSQI